ncbi:MAG TPA: tetratricopeptide repeat protein [Verrucomicrobiae bacterium]
MTPKDYFKPAKKITAKKDMPGVFSEWLLLCDYELTGSQMLIVDSDFAPLASDGLLIDLPSGPYQFLVQGADYGGDKRVSAVRVIRSGAASVLGQQIGETWTDTGTTGFCECEKFIQAFGEDEDAVLEKIRAAVEKAKCCGVLAKGKTKTPIMPFASSGFGDGTHPVFELLAYGKRVGLEVRYIAETRKYPFDREPIKPEAKPASPAAQSFLPAIMLESDAVVKAKAKDGDTNAQCDLARRYTSRKDFKKAFYWLQQAAEGGLDRAQFLLGDTYTKGIMIPKDLTLAAHWYRAASEQGYADAQRNLGFMYQMGQGVPQDHAKAREYYELAAKQGDASALGNLGIMFHDGLGVERDHKRAAELYSLAAEKKNLIAINNLGVLYRHGLGVSQDHAKAASLYQSAARGGYAVAQYNYAMMLSQGLGVPQDLKEAIKWYTLAAAAGHAGAQCNLGHHYYQGIGVAQNLAVAIQWFRKGADQGHAICENNLGDAYETGKGVEQDFSEAVKWYRKAAEKNVAIAQKSLGVLLINGQGVTKDLAQGIQWLQRAADQGNAEAIQLLALHQRKES